MAACCVQFSGIPLRLVKIPRHALQSGTHAETQSHHQRVPVVSQLNYKLVILDINLNATGWAKLWALARFPVRFRTCFSTAKLARMCCERDCGHCGTGDIRRSYTDTHIHTSQHSMTGDLQSKLIHLSISSAASGQIVSPGSVSQPRQSMGARWISANENRLRLMKCCGLGWSWCVCLCGPVG